MTFDLGAVREQFPALSISDDGQPRVYFDNPGGTQVPRAVIDSMSRCLVESNANIQGGFRTSNLVDALINDAHQSIADLLNAPSSDEVIFGQNMTSLTFHMSRSIGRKLKPGDEIVLSRMCHDGNVGPWLLLARDLGLKVRWMPFNAETFEFDLDELDKILSDKTRLVCIGGASNMTGTINDIKSICARAREAGAWTYVDAVQSVPHVSTDVQALGCDFLVCSPYKFFGPHIGTLWGRRELLESMQPYKVRPATSRIPGCFETGTMNHEGMAGTAAAVAYFASIGETMAQDYLERNNRFDGRRQHIHAAMDCLFDYERQLAEQLIGGLQQLPGVRVHGITDAAAMDRRVPTVSFSADGMAPDAIAEQLAARNIFVWWGDFYAIEVAKTLGLLDAGVVRVGPVHYNSSAEIDQFLNAMSDILPRANVA